MANTYTKLAAARPSDTNETELYEVGSGESIIATLHICNQTSSDLSYSIALTDESGAAEDEDWICYSFPIQGTYSHSRYFSIGEGNTVRVKSSSADSISFVLEGLKIT